MPHIFKLFTYLFLSVTLIACSSDKDNIDERQALELYNTANDAMQRGDWLLATTTLENLDRQYPFGAYSEQTQLNLIYVYYKSSELDLALSKAQSFYNLYPSHKNTDWVLYLEGLTYVEKDRVFFHDIFSIDRTNRNSMPRQKAFDSFKKLVTNYPDSHYAKDSYQHLILLKNQIAKHHLHIIQFYIDKEAWVSALNRAISLQELYPSTIYARMALEHQLTAYRALNMHNQIEETKNKIQLNK